MPLHRTGIAIAAGAFGSIAVTAIGVSAPRSSTPAYSPPATAAPLLATGHASLAAPGRHPKTRGGRGIETAALSDVVKTFCTNCHNPRQLRGNLDLTGYNVDSAPARLDVSEKMIRKLRAQMMPPPGSKRPQGDTLLALVETLENIIDKGARPNPGTRTFQRLNRAEYERAVRDLLGVEIDAGDYLPLDTKSANFDNIADVQSLSPTLLEAYLNAAAAVSRMALGDPDAPALSTSYATSVFTSQHPWDHVEGTPYGTRGGIVAAHPFPADGMYTFRVNVRGGVGTKLEDVDVSIDGERVALLHYERGVERSLSSADAPQGADYLRTEPILVKAGQQRVSVAFVRRSEGPYEDLIRPHDWSLASSGSDSAGTTEPPHVMELAIVGPLKVDRRFRIAEPADRVLVPPGEAGRSGAVRRADRHAPRNARLPSSADAARPRRPDGLLRRAAAAGAARRVRGGRPDRAPGDPGEPVFRLPLRARAGERRARAGLQDQRRRSRLAPLVLPLGHHSRRAAAGAGHREETLRTRDA